MAIGEHQHPHTPQFSGGKEHFGYNFCAFSFPLSPLRQAMGTSNRNEAAASPILDPSIHANQETYRDLVIFEERLRGNMTRLQRRKRKFEGKLNCFSRKFITRICKLMELFMTKKKALLAALFILLAYFFYVVFLEPSKVRTMGRRTCIYLIKWGRIGFLDTFNQHNCVACSCRKSCVLLSFRDVCRKDCFCIRVSSCFLF